jgi:transcriptional regulator with XRE-family HTH domain
MHSVLELKKCILSLLKERGLHANPVLAELGISPNMISVLGARSGYPTGERIAKIALYLNVSVDYLLGVSVPDKEPGQTVLELCLAMAEEERKAFVQEMSGMEPDDAPSNEAQFTEDDNLSESKYKRLHARLNAIKSETSNSIRALCAMQNAMDESVCTLVQAPDPNKSLILQFLDLPRHQQKLFVLEAIVRMNNWQP